jgi:putative transposase
MSTKRTRYSTRLKTKLILDVLKGDKTINELSSEHNIHPKNLQNWKATFLANAELAMEPNKIAKEYKIQLIKLQDKNDEYAKVVGQLTVEKEWAVKKLQSLGLSEKQALVDPKLKSVSLLKQTQLLNISRGHFYYQPIENKIKAEIKSHIADVFNKIPIYGERKVHQQCLEDGFNISLNTVSKYRKEMGLTAVLAVRPHSSTISDGSHIKYPYKLEGLEIIRANQVWSTDITYIKLHGGMVYLAAIIDWYSKAVLSYRIANTMDVDLVTSVLDEALLSYGNPEIFNTDQGSQYTSYIHTNRLKNKGIIISMDGKGRATDNIAIERFWRSVKCERVYLNDYQSVIELKDDVKDYIEFYNHRRFHQTLGYQKPMDVYHDSLHIQGSSLIKKVA